MTFYSLLSEDFYIVRSHLSNFARSFVLCSNLAAANVRPAANKDNPIEEIVINLAVQDLHKL